MKTIDDEKNICLRCAYGTKMGKVREGTETEWHEWCICDGPSVYGKNKGRRQKCADYRPKKEETT